MSGIVAADDAATAVRTGTSGHETLTDFALVGDRTGDGYGDIALATRAAGMVLEGPLTGAMAQIAVESAAWATIAPPDDNIIESVHVSGDIDGDGRPGLVFDGNDTASRTVYVFTEPTAGSNATLQAGLTARGTDELAFGASVDTNAAGLEAPIWGARGLPSEGFVPLLWRGSVLAAVDGRVPLPL